MRSGTEFASNVDFLRASRTVFQDLKEEEREKSKFNRNVGDKPKKSEKKKRHGMTNKEIPRGSRTHYSVDICIVDADFTRFVNIYRNCYIVMIIIIALSNRIPKTLQAVSKTKMDTVAHANGALYSVRGKKSLYRLGVRYKYY